MPEAMVEYAVKYRVLHSIYIKFSIGSLEMRIHGCWRGIIKGAYRDVARRLTSSPPLKGEGPPPFRGGEVCRLHSPEGVPVAGPPALLPLLLAGLEVMDSKPWRA
jgi:hypothetical protein